MYLGWAARFINGKATLSKQLITLHVSSGLLKFMSTSTYTVSVYTYIKHAWRQEVEMVHHNTIHSCNIHIAVIPTVGTPPCFEDYGAQNVKGFCAPNGIFSGIFSGPYIHCNRCLAYCRSLFFLSIELISCIYTHFHLHETKCT